MAQLVYLKDGTAQVWHDKEVSGSDDKRAHNVIEAFDLSFTESFLPISVLTKVYPCTLKNS